MRHAYRLSPDYPGELTIFEKDISRKFVCLRWVCVCVRVCMRERERERERALLISRKCLLLPANLYFLPQVYDSCKPISLEKRNKDRNNERKKRENKQWYHCMEWQRKVFDWIKKNCDFLRYCLIFNSFYIPTAKLSKFKSSTFSLHFR